VILGAEHSITSVWSRSSDGRIVRSHLPIPISEMFPGAGHYRPCMREPDASIRRKSTHSAWLLIGIVLTFLAVVAHRVLPERRLTLDGSKDLAYAFLMQSGDGAPADIQWVDQSRFHFACQFPKAAAVEQGCSFGYQLHSGKVNEGIDLSRFKTLNLAVRYTGEARYLRVAIRNFDPRFSRLEDLNSPKYNFVNIPSRDLSRPVAIKLTEFWVPEWWIAQYDLPRSQSQPDIGNATIFSIDLRGHLAGTQHDIQIDTIEFVGDWISAEYWYLGILCLWMIVATTYGISQWVLLRRKHREQRLKIHDLEGEKERYRKLSTLDALTNVLNRHGIERFVETLQATRVPASVIVIDIDNFKRVNDQRGHYGGDRVLRKMGEILRAATRNTDGLGRWGGEEFVLVCPGANLTKAAELAEKLRQIVMQTNFIPEDPLPITASFGVSATHADQNFEDAFRQADEALYLAKSRGRNCVVAAAEDQMHNVTGAGKGTWARISGRFRLYK
jgi:diguanylate cyclase (GGDEF)-like protein